jgi:hypothetical protein
MTVYNDYWRRDSTEIVVNLVSIASIIRGLFSPAPTIQQANPLHITIETVERLKFIIIYIENAITYE